MKKILIIYNLVIFCFCFSQKKFKVQTVETNTWQNIFLLIDEKGNLIKKLDTAKYYANFNTEEYRYFAVFGVKNQSDWIAIDATEKILFSIYNTSYGEPSPDELIENKIRIVDKINKIGFANNKGKIIIQPQFEIATSFYNDKAIIGRKCQKILWNSHPMENDGCQHFSIQCRENGYINKNGKIMQLGNFTFEEIKKKINWKEYLK